MWPEAWPAMIHAISERMMDLRVMGRIRVHPRLAPWVRQAAERRGMRIETRPWYDGMVEIRRLGGDADDAPRD